VSQTIVLPGQLVVIPPNISGVISPSPNNPVSGTTYTFQASDIGTLVVFTNNGGTVTATIPTGLTLGGQIFVQQSGTSIVTLAGGVGVTFSAVGGVATTLTQNGVTTLQSVATNTWIAQGNLGPSMLSATGVTIVSPTATGYATAQLSFDYDSTHRGRIWTDSGGQVYIGAPDSGKWNFDYQGASLWGFANNVLSVNNSAGQIGIFTGGSYTAGRPRLSVGVYGSDQDPGLSDGGAINTVGFCIGGSDMMVLTSSTFTLSSVLLRVQGGTNPLVTTTSNITTGAGSSAGTLTNAPSIGNPTKWFPINDNGTTRYVPAW
jgi:hypothetical protein